jgi:hypothetical protein
MTPNRIITAVRNRLGDTKEQRWDEETLLLYVSLCQIDICITTDFHRKEYIMPIYENTFLYNLPTDCIRVERLEYECKFFPIESRNTIDSKDAVFPCALKDNLAFGKIEIKLEDTCETLTAAFKDAYGVVSSTTGGECTLANAYGVVSSITDDINPVPPELPAIIGYMKVYYSAVPELIPTIDDTMILPDMWISAFIHYVCGMALQDDNDANNVQRGEMEGAKYLRMLGQIGKAASKDFTSNYKSKLVTKFRRT